MTLVPSAVAAVALGVRPCTIRQMIRRGKLTRYGTVKRALVDLGECERAMIPGMATTTTPESRARIAYTAYGRKTGFKNFQGGEMPLFEELPETIREAWIAAAGVIWDLATTGKATI